MLITDSEKEIILKKLYSFIDENCIFRCDPEVKYNYCSDIGNITPKGTGNKNMKSQWFLRRLTHNPIALEWVSILFLNDLVIKIKNGEEDSNIQLAGLETGSLPLLAGMQIQAMKFNIPLFSFSVRKDRKSYGLFNYIEGIPSEGPVVFVDDLVNSGSTINRCYDIIKYELELQVANNSYFIIDLHNDRTHLGIDGKEVCCNYLFKGKEFSREYDKEKYWLPKDCDKSRQKRPEYFRMQQNKEEFF